MGRHPDPTCEELEFIFERLKTLSDKEVLEDMQDVTFPLRSPRFIKQRRLHYDVARKVLRAEVEKEIDPIIVERRKEHYDELANAARYIVHRVSGARGTPESDDFYLDGIVVRKWELSGELTNNIGNLGEIEGGLLFDSFQSHLCAEYPEIQSQGISVFADENPYRLIEMLRILTKRKTFQGTCPVCESWSGYMPQSSRYDNEDHEREDP